MLFNAKEKITREIAKGLYFIETSNIGENVDDEELFLKRLLELEEKIEIIDNELRKYNLIIDSYDVTKIIDYPIIISAYPS